MATQASEDMRFQQETEARSVDARIAKLEEEFDRKNLKAIRARSRPDFQSSYGFWLEKGSGGREYTKTRKEEGHPQRAQKPALGDKTWIEDRPELPCDPEAAEYLWDSEN